MTSTGPGAATCEVVKARLGGCCLRCGGQGEQIHHRQPRQMGGTRDPKINSPENLVFICRPCHEHIERNRAESYRDGWLVRRGFDPGAQYLITQYERMLMLHSDGSMTSNYLPAIEGVPF